MIMEYLDVVDEDNNLTGEVVEKEIIHDKGIWHREAVIWTVNEKGEILLQKRAAEKKFGANKWATCAGHIGAGEDIAKAAKRELFEEVGLNSDELEFLFAAKVEDTREDGIINRQFMYMYFVKTNVKIEDYKIQYEELSELKYITIEELEQIVINKDDNVTFSKRQYMPRLIEELRKRI